MIRSIACLSMGIAALMVAAPVLAAEPAPPHRTRVEVPPPPGIDDPGVNPDRSAQAAPPERTDHADTKPAPIADSDPNAPLPKPDTRLVRDKASRTPAKPSAERMAASEVTEREEGGDSIEEYRQDGRVWMIRVRPANGGPVRIYRDENGDGRLDRHPEDGPVSPVYYTLYEWN